MDISNDAKLLEWLENIEASKGTRDLYISFMTKFCGCVGMTPTELLKESIVELKQGLLPSERNIGGHIAKYKAYMNSKGYADKTFNVGMAAIRSFYNVFDIPIPNSAKKSKRAEIKKENNNWLKKEDVIKIIVNAKNLREKAIILFMASSGMARREILNLQFKDISIDNEGIGTVSVRRDKTDVDYVTFLSPEATIALKNYKDELDRNEKTKIKNEDDYVFVSYTTGNQLDEETFSALFTIMGKQLGYETKNGYIKSRSHALRKFFSSTLEDAGIPKVKVDFMIGHTVDGTDKAYFNRNPETLKEMYKTYLPYITFEKTIKVMSLTGEDAKSLHAELEAAKSQVADLLSMKKEWEEIQILLKEKLGIETRKTDFKKELKEIFVTDK